MHLAHCFLHIASYTLYLTHCILHIAYYTLHLTHCILHVASYTLHLTRCILHVASYMLHPYFKSRSRIPAARAASSVAGWLLLLRSNCLSGSHPFSFVGLLILVWVVVHHIILLILKKFKKNPLQSRSRDAEITFLLRDGEEGERII